MDRDYIAVYLGRGRGGDINTDDNARLEYRTPFEFLGRPDAIVPGLMRHAGWTEPNVFAEDCGPDIRHDARGFFD